MSNEREEWVRRIEAARELDELALIDDAIAQIGEDWSGPLRFRIGLRKLALRKATGQGATRGNSSASNGSKAGAASRPATRPAPSHAFAAAYGLPIPDGRRLHAYRLTADAFAALQREIERTREIKSLLDGYRAGYFVLWASEWFRRCWQGGARRWEDLTDALQLPPLGQSDQTALREVTQKGLEQWARPIFVDGNKHYLATLAREGGFPAHAVADGAKGWASQALGAIIGSLMGNPASGEEDALVLARAQKSRMPQVFCDDDFAQLCADLALAIVEIRREAEPQASAANLPLTAWLGLHRSNWREALPISTTDAAADALVEMLMQIQAVRGNLVGVERMLMLQPNGIWAEAMRMTLDGAISGGPIDQVDVGFGRLRAFAAGGMARYITGELGLFEPPVDGEKEWHARSARPSRGVLRLPFDLPVQLDLRTGDQILSRIELPGGKPRRGQLLVLSLDEGSAEEPRVLRVVGSGSGRYRAEQVYLRIPSGWTVENEEDGTVELIGDGQDSLQGATTLWSVVGGAKIFDVTGDCYRILCRQPADIAHRLELFGDTVKWAELSGPVDLYLGSPKVSCNGGGDLVWRAIGTRNWRSLIANLPVGHYELGWRRDGEMLDRRRIAVLPSTAKLVRAFDGKTASFSLSGFFPASIKPQVDGPVSPTANGTQWSARSGAPSVRRFKAEIQWRDAPSLEVEVAFPGEASITRWNGKVLPNRTLLTLDDFRDLVARDDGQIELLAELRDPGSRERAEMSWTFREELPLTAIAADVASLLLPAKLDAEVVLDMNNGINTTWHVRKFPLTLNPEGAGFVASAAITDGGVEICGRALANPLEERCFGPYTLLSDANHRPASLPEDLTGDWLIFLRAGKRVLTRPRYQPCKELAEPSGLLGIAMASPHSALDAALDDLLDHTAKSDTLVEPRLDELLRLTTSLRGLPPETFRVFELLSGHPTTLARLAFAANETQRDEIIGLAQALPFAWYLLPKEAWNAARGTLFATVQVQLEALGDKASEYALQTIELTTKALVEHEPLLAAVLCPSRYAEPIGEIAMRFLQRGAIDRVRGPSWGRYRQIDGLALPSRFLDFNSCVLDVLDAPCAAAGAVLGQWSPTPAQVRHIKLAARSFPTWFSEAFAASLAGA